MGLKILLRKFKVQRFSSKAIEDKQTTKRRKAWTGMSHGFHTVERSGEISEGSLLAQREQIGGLEVWLFGAFDKKTGSGIKNYLQAHLLEKNLSEYQFARKSEEIMKKAYLSTRAKVHAEEKTANIGGSTTLLVMNCERFVAADFGGYKAVVCRDGKATPIRRKDLNNRKGKWSISDLFNMTCASTTHEKPLYSGKLVVTSQKVDPVTDFIILASDGVWEVIRSQEAVDLVSHMEDAQKAAECLAEEALTRMSKSTISCIIVRFH